MDGIPYILASILRWFSYERTVERCTEYGMLNNKWCATKVNSENRYVPGHWGTCPDTDFCNTMEGNGGIIKYLRHVALQ